MAHGHFDRAIEPNPAPIAGLVMMVGGIPCYNTASCSNYLHCCLNRDERKVDKNKRSAKLKVNLHSQ